MTRFRSDSWRARAEDPQRRREMAVDLLNSATSAIQAGRPDEALPLLEGVIGIARMSEATQSDEPDRLLATALTMLGGVLLSRGRRDEAQVALTEAVALTGQIESVRPGPESAVLEKKARDLLSACLRAPVTIDRGPAAPRPSTRTAEVAARPVRKPHRTGRWRTVVAIVLVGLFLLFGTSSGQDLIAPAVVRLRLAMPFLGDGGYTFMHTQNGQPVTFSSCRQLRVVINDDHRPAGAERLVEEAVANVADATGLAIYVAGSTSEPPNPSRPAVQARYGPGWAPILISWTSPDVIPELQGDPIARGGPRGLTDPATGRDYYVTGQVFLDTPAIKTMLHEGRRASVRAIIMHELGHVMGLGHVNSHFELMEKRVNGLTRYGPGDLKGLARLGHGPCI